MDQDPQPSLGILGLMAAAAGGLAYLVAKALAPVPATQPRHTVQEYIGPYGPCYYCGQPGTWCPRCTVYKCPAHHDLAHAVAGALGSKVLGLRQWPGGPPPAGDGQNGEGHAGEEAH